jgi:hypothetical protein
VGVSLTVRVKAGNLGYLSHDNRDFIAKNVDGERTAENIVYKQEDLKAVYQKLFGAAVAGYNSRQVRADRRIVDYYERVKHSKQEKLFYEAIVQYGNKDDLGFQNGNAETAKQMLNDYMNDFQKRNPHLYVFNAVMHNDEATPHLHIDFVPVATHQRRGMEMRTSLKTALAQQNIFAKDTMKTERQQWAVRERKTMTDIAKEYGVEIEYKNDHHKHLSVDEYKIAKDEIRKLENRLTEIYNNEDINVRPEDVKLLKAEIKNLRAALKNSKEPLTEFEIPDEEKLSEVSEKLEKQGVQFVQFSHGVVAPVSAAAIVSETAKNFTPQKGFETLRDKLSLAIDKNIYFSKNFDELLQNLRAEGYSIKSGGKYVAAKPPGGERFIRFKSLGAEYEEAELKKRIENKDKFYENCQKKIRDTSGMEKSFHTASAGVMVIFYRRQLEPRKADRRMPYTFRNDRRIRKLIDAATLIERDKLTVDNVDAKVDALTTRKAELIKLIGIEKNTQGDNLTELQAELKELNGKLSAYTEIIEMAKEIKAGSYIDKLVADERERQKEKFENSDLTIG